MIGLALSGADKAEVRRVLGEQHGVATNKVDGIWTGVSFARYQKLVDLIREAYRNPENGKSPTYQAALMQFMWSTARSKQDCVDFLLHHDAVASEPCLAIDLTCPERQRDFLQESFTQTELQSPANLEAAAHAVLEERSSDEDFASSFELLGNVRM